MKYLFLTLLLALALAPGAQAQSANTASWCPVGATWQYGYSLFDEAGTLTVKYVRDTLVAGQPAQLLARQVVSHARNVPSSPSSSYSKPSVITRVVADRVEVQANGQFYTLYDFAAQPSSSWLTPRVVPAGPCPAELVRVTVDSVGQQQVNGRMLRWFRTHLTSPTGAAVVGQWDGRIYEQVGHLGYMQPQSPTCAGTDPGYMGKLISYQAAGWPAITYNPATGTFALATAQARAAAASFYAYPNPGAGLLTLELPTTVAPAATLRLLDLAGRTVRQLLVPASRQLDVRALPAGTYTLLLESTSQPALAHRLVLE